jgi:hypothetical protein
MSTQLTTAPSVDPPTSTAASKPVTSDHVAGLPTAAVIAQIDISRDRTVIASLGFALHHLSDALVGSIGDLDLHRATTIMTKQIVQIVQADDAVDQIGHLVCNPDRVAMPDGRSAAELCGSRWQDVAAASQARAVAAREGVSVYGNDAVINLAMVRGAQGTTPWWGTSMWAQIVNNWFDVSMPSPRLRTALKHYPEQVDDAVVAAVLAGTTAARSVMMSWRVG